MGGDDIAGLGGCFDACGMMKVMIAAGGEGIYFEDKLDSAKKCGHMGGKVLVPPQEFVQKLVAARLAADIMGVPTILVARTDANGAKLLTSDSDIRDVEFLTGQRTSEGFLGYKGALDAAINRALLYAPYADLISSEPSTPPLYQPNPFTHPHHS